MYDPSKPVGVYYNCVCIKLYYVLGLEAAIQTTGFQDHNYQGLEYNRFLQPM